VIVRERAEPRFSGVPGFSAISASGLLRSVWLWFHAIMLIAFLVGLAGSDDTRLGAILVVMVPILVLHIMFLYSLLTTVYRDRPGLFVLALVVPLFNFLFILYTLITSPATLIRPAKIFATIVVVTAYCIGLILMDVKRFPHGRANAAVADPTRYSAPGAPPYSPPEPFPSHPPTPARVITHTPPITRTPSPNRIPTPAPTPARAPAPGPDATGAPFTVHIR
jgi:hypothetical protein